MLCLDTYALFEIKNNNPKYAVIANRDFILSDLTLAEFYWVMMRDEGSEIAYSWYRKLKPFAVKTNVDMHVEAMDFRFKHRKAKLSFFDCIGYVTAQLRNYQFVTGDKEFEKIKGVLYIK